MDGSETGSIGAGESMKCSNCDGTGKIKEYSRASNFKQAKYVECNWCNGTGIQRKFL